MTNELPTKLPPVAVCTNCGKYSYSAESIGKHCHEVHGKKRCKGGYQSAMTNTDWQPCPSCHTMGCEACQKSGFIFVRKR